MNKDLALRLRLRDMVPTAVGSGRRRPGKLFGRPNGDESDREPDDEADDDVPQRPRRVEGLGGDERGADPELSERHDDLPATARDLPVRGFPHGHSPT